MELMRMRYKTFTWPHNPEKYAIEYHRVMAADKLPLGAYQLQNLGRTYRVFTGEGAFTGEEAYDRFKALASLFYEDTPGILVHPVWQPSTAWLVDLALEQEPKRDYVGYRFTFWECEAMMDYDPLETVMTGYTTRLESGRYTVAQGETLWDVAARLATTAEAILALNPQIKNPNLLSVGQVLQVSP